MSLTLKDKKILITGSSDGLGKLLAIEVAKLGAEVILHGRDKSKIEKVRNEIKEITGQEVKYIISDFSKPENIESDFIHLKELDILVNNTGVWYEGRTVEMNTQDLINMVNINLTSYLIISKLMLTTLQKSEFSQILNVASQAGVNFSKDWTVYTATKFAVQAFGESLTREYDNTNTRMMTFYPGGMETGIFKKAGLDYKPKEPWMFDPIESVEAMIFMMTRNKKVNIKRMDMVNHLYI